MRPLPCSPSGHFHPGHAPRRKRDPDAFTSARVGDLVVDAGRVLVADDGGAIFPDKVREIVAAAWTIREREHQQAELLAAGNPFNSSASPSTSTDTPPIPRIRCVSTCRRLAERSRRDGCEGS